MEITFLGSGNAFAADGRYWSSFLVDKKYLFDAPPTLLPHLKQLRVPLPDIEVIFLTHHHGDHFMGVPFLFLEYFYMTERSNDLYIVGPPGVREWIEDFADRCYPNITRDAGYRRIYVDAVPRKQQQAGAISFWSVPMNHVKELKKPIFIVAGANDPRVPKSEADQMAAALQQQGTPVWYLVGKDEGHGFAKKKNADFQFYATIAFVEKHLLGKSNN